MLIGPYEGLFAQPIENKRRPGHGHHFNKH
jgi:hypothetical protein